MHVTFIQPPHKGSVGRGIGFLNERLLENLREIKGLKIKEKEFNFWKLNYPESDLAHFSYFDEYFFTLPPFFKSKFVLTIPDLTKLKFTRHFPVGLRGKIAWPIQKYLASKATAIITISEASKKDIEIELNIDPRKIFVTHLASDRELRPIQDRQYLKTVAQKYHLPPKFVLYVGGINWNKNLPSLVKACQLVSVPLVIVGKEAFAESLDLNHAESRSFVEVLNLIRGDPNIIRLGFVPTAELAAIYNLAKVYVQPSVYEGFGLPVLEALSCGTPIICGKNSSFPEIVGQAASFANVTDPTDLADKITKVQKTGKEVSQAAKFSWQKTAQKTYQVYEKVLAGL